MDCPQGVICQIFDFSYVLLRDSFEVSLSSKPRCLGSWKSEPHPGISQCISLLAGLSSGCSGQIQEPNGLGSGMLMSGPWFPHFPSSMAEPTWPRTWQPQASGAIFCCSALGMTTPECFWLLCDSLVLTKE